MNATSGSRSRSRRGEGGAHLERAEAHASARVVRAVDGTQRLGALGVPELERRAAAGEQAARAMVLERVDHVLQSTEHTVGDVSTSAVVQSQ